MEHFSHICRTFFPDCQLLAVEEITIGHINQTYKVTLSRPDGTQDYLLQALNTYVFPQPEQVMENIARISAHLSVKAPQSTLLHFFSTPQGQNFYQDHSGFWRICNFIPSLSYSSVENLDIVREAGLAFGQFQQQLSDFPADDLHETIINFHNTRSRYAALKAAAAADSVGRLAACRAEYDALLAMEDEACLLTDLLNEGKLPLRVSHNDTKINNVLFDDKGKALCVIDLDTVMPGLVAHDFGDALRTGANPEAEDSTNLDKVKVNMDVFCAFCEGFLAVLSASLSETELNTLANGFLTLTAEQAVRFLTDYLQGDPYYRVEHSEHNLQRTRCQLTLAQDVQLRLPQLKDIVLRCAKAK